jgi:hypothetical protein
MSGLLITGVAPGGQGDGAAAAVSTAGAGAGGGTGIATAGAGGGSATAATGVGGGGAGIATAGAGAGSGAGVPVMLGARAIGPGGGSTIVGGLLSAAGGGTGCWTGEHAPSHSGIVTAIAAAIRRTSRPDFSLSPIAASSISGMASPGVISPEDYALPVPYGTTRERRGSVDRVEQSQDRAAQIDRAIRLAHHVVAEFLVRVLTDQIGEPGGEQHLQPRAQQARRMGEIDAIEPPGHNDIGEQQIDSQIRVRQQEAIGIIAAHRLEDAVTCRLDYGKRDLAHIAIVVDDKNGFFRLCHLARHKSHSENDARARIAPLRRAETR